MLSMTDRSRRMNVLMTNEERAMLQALADERGVTASDWVRLAVRNAFDALKKKTERNS